MYTARTLQIRARTVWVGAKGAVKGRHVMSDDSELRRRLMTPLQEEKRPVREALGKFVPRGRLAAVLIALVLLLVVGACTAQVVSGLTQQFQIVDAIKQFCIAEGSGNYAKAYGLLSTGLRERLTQEDFAAKAKDSTLAQCDLHGRGAVGLLIEVQNGVTMVPVDYLVRGGPDGNDQTIEGTMRLVHEDAGWRIDFMDAPGLSLP